jgi:hypothetical protein
METVPHSEACERNKHPILEVLRQYCIQGRLIEMGFGTAQHCTFMSGQLPAVEWFACDHPDYHKGFLARTKELGCSANLKGPYTLWAGTESFVQQLDEQSLPLSYDYFYSANTLHIMNKESVDYFCQHVSDVLKPSGLLFLYGPFRFHDRPFAPSNQSFHEILVARGVGSGIRQVEYIQDRLNEHFLGLIKVFEMPANNHMLVFQKQKDEDNG